MGVKNALTFQLSTCVHSTSNIINNVITFVWFEADYT